MNLETRIEKLEARQRAIEIENGPNCFQRADRDVDGTVISCERICFPSPSSLPSGMAGGIQAFAAMTREPYRREACHYVECEHRDTCRADGSPTSWARRQ